MASVITIEGIDQAIANLNYRNTKTLKHRLVATIRRFYGQQSSVESLQNIDADKLIQLLWDTGNDPLVVKTKRRNLSSIKSAVNADLGKLFRDGKNSQGIAIGPENTFVMSDEAKEAAFRGFSELIKESEAVTLDQITDVLNVVNSLVSKPEDLATEDNSDPLEKLEKLRELIENLGKTVGLEKLQASVFSATEADETEPVEDGPEAVEHEEVQVPEESEVDEVLDEVDIEEVLDETDVEEVELEEEVDVLEEDEDPDEIPDEAEVDEEDFEELEEITEVPEFSWDVPLYEDVHRDDSDDERIEKARLLAEQFDSSLSPMDKLYNQHVTIPEGEYMIGRRRPGRNEGAERKVSLKSFHMARFSVTNGLFEIFVEKTGYRTTAERLGYGMVYYGRYQRVVDERTGLEKFIWNSALISKSVEGACWYQPHGPGSTLHNKRNHPVVQVSMEDAMIFAAWTGKRLPTEPEWEAASRTLRGYEFPWGKEWREDACNIEESCIGGTTPVDKYMELENDSGVVDSLGNVLEWTTGDPTLEAAPESESAYGIAKGGSWVSGNDTNLCTRLELEREFRSNILGFRCIAF